MQPVKADGLVINVLSSSDSEDEPCSSVLSRLEWRDEVGKSEQNAVTIVQSRKDECNNKRPR